MTASTSIRIGLAMVVLVTGTTLLTVGTYNENSLSSAVGVSVLLFSLGMISSIYETCREVR